MLSRQSSWKHVVGTYFSFIFHPNEELHVVRTCQFFWSCHHEYMWSVHIFHSFSSEWRFACARNDCREGMSIVFLNTKLNFTHHCNFHPYIPSRRLSRGNVKFFFSRIYFFPYMRHMFSRQSLWAHVVKWRFTCACSKDLSIFFEVVIVSTCGQ